MKVAVVLLSSPEGERRIEAPENTSLVLGRSRKCDVPIEDTAVSQRHCAMVLKAGVVSVTNLNSTNGIRFGGDRLQKCFLSVGDSCKIGRTRLTLESIDDASLARPPQSPGNSGASIHAPGSDEPPVLEEITPEEYASSADGDRPSAAGPQTRRSASALDTGRSGATPARRRPAAQEKAKSRQQESSPKVMRAAQTPDRRQVTTEWHDNGAKKGEGATLAGIQVGKWSYWREDGSLLRVGSYSRGTPTGVWRHSTPSGEVIGVDAKTCAPEKVIWHSRSPLTPGDGPSQGWLLAGGRSGPWTHWRADGSLLSEGSYQKGQRTGHWRHFHPDGSLEREGDYEKGERRGRWTFLSPGGVQITQDFSSELQPDVRWAPRHPDPDTRLQAEGWTIGGKRAGFWRSWWPDGGLESEGEYLDGARTGEWNFRDEQGAVESTGRFSRGEREGSWTYTSPVGGRLVLDDSYSPDVRVEWCDGTSSEHDGTGWLVDGAKQGHWDHPTTDAAAGSSGEYLRGSRHGRWEHCWPDGSLRSTGRYHEGTPQGSWTYRSRDGAQVSVELSGPTPEQPVWHERAVLGDETSESQGWMLGGRREGPWTFWHPEGAESGQGSFIAGRREGSWTFYDPDSNRVAAGSFEAGERHGTWENYWPDGSLNSTGNYHEGTAQREWTYRSRDGAQVSVELSDSTPEEPVWHERALLGDETEESQGWMLRDRREGPWTFWHPEGPESCEGSFIDGRREGIWTFYGPNSNRVAAGSFAKGERHGGWELFYPSESLRARGEYSEGRRSGCWEQWREDGTGRAVGFYKGGKPNGHWGFLSREEGVRGDLGGQLEEMGTPPSQKNTERTQLRKPSASSAERQATSGSRPRRHLNWRQWFPSAASVLLRLREGNADTAQSTEVADRRRWKAGSRAAEHAAAAEVSPSSAQELHRGGRSKVSVTAISVAALIGLGIGLSIRYAGELPSRHDGEDSELPQPVVENSVEQEVIGGNGTRLARADLPSADEMPPAESGVSLPGPKRSNPGEEKRQLDSSSEERTERSLEQEVTGGKEPRLATADLPSADEVPPAESALSLPASKRSNQREDKRQLDSTSEEKAELPSFGMSLTSFVEDFNAYAEEFAAAVPPSADFRAEDYRLNLERTEEFGVGCKRSLYSIGIGKMVVTLTVESTPAQEVFSATMRARWAEGEYSQSAKLALLLTLMNLTRRIDPSFSSDDQDELFTERLRLKDLKGAEVARVHTMKGIDYAFSMDSDGCGVVFSAEVAGLAGSDPPGENEMLMADKRKIDSSSDAKKKRLQFFQRLLDDRTCCGYGFDRECSKKATKVVVMRQDLSSGDTLMSGYRYCDAHARLHLRDNNDEGVNGFGILKKSFEVRPSDVNADNLESYQAVVDRR